jgi:hypothetical protein
MKEVSDLIGVEVTLALMVWLLCVLVAFFFVGPVVGILVILAGIALGGFAAVRVIVRSDTS